MSSYSNDPRLNFRKQHIENERKPVPTSVARTVANKDTVPKAQGVKGVKDQTGDSTRREFGGKPNTTTTSSKGSKRN